MNVYDFMQELEVDTMVRESAFWRTHKILGLSIDDKSSYDTVYETEVSRDLIEWLLDRWKKDYQYIPLFNSLVNLGYVDEDLFLKHAKADVIDSSKKAYFYISTSNPEVIVIRGSFARFARRCGGIAIESFPVGDVVNGVPSNIFNNLLNECKIINGYAKAGISVYYGVYYLLKGRFCINKSTKPIPYNYYFQGDTAEKVDDILSKKFPIALSFDYNSNSFVLCDIVKKER